MTPTNSTTTIKPIVKLTFSCGCGAIFTTAAEAIAHTTKTTHGVIVNGSIKHPAKTGVKLV